MVSSRMSIKANKESGGGQSGRWPVHRRPSSASGYEGRWPGQWRMEFHSCHCISQRPCGQEIIRRVSSRHASAPRHRLRPHAAAAAAYAGRIVRIVRTSPINVNNLVLRPR